MRRVAVVALAAVLLAGYAAPRPGATRSDSTPEMKAIFDADQSDRADEDRIDWSKVGPRDVARRERTLKLLGDGRLNTGSDFRYAALIFQHGDTPNDILLAHTLAVISAAKGESKAAWIAAATLDRYLQYTKQPQIYGTQYSAKQGEAYGQDPYDRRLISDALRRELGVPSLAKQQDQARELTAEAAAAHTKP